MLSLSSGSPSLMSQARSTRDRGCRSQLIQPVAVCLPQPQLSRVTDALVKDGWVTGGLVMSLHRLSVYTELFKQSGQHPVRIEVLLGDRAGGTAVPLVIATNRLDTRNRLVKGAERQQPLADGVQLGQTGIARQHRAAGGKVVSAAIAQQPAAAGDVHVLGDHELGGTLADVFAIRVGAARDRLGIDQRPAALAQEADVAIFRRMNVEREFETRAWAPLRQIRELSELVDALTVGLALVLERRVRASPG